MNEQHRSAAAITVVNRVWFARAAGVLMLGAGLLSACAKKEPSAQAGPPPAMPVSVVEVKESDVPLTGEWVGTLDGYVNAQIQPQAA
jgi:membrane fusion protein (multidrug efflux system)